MAGQSLVSPPSPPPPPPNLDDYAPSATVIPFDRPIPLLRGPLKTSPSDNPEAGPYILAFKDPKKWASAYKACEAQILQQCETGARIGCSIAASDKCKPPWWKNLIVGGAAGKQDFAERAKCEEREMEACIEASKGRCREFAEMKCLTAFREARVAVKGLDLPANRKEVAKLLSWVCLENSRREMLKSDSSWVKFRSRFELCSCKGSDLLGSGNVNDIDEYVKQKF
ncbi:OLC1v1007179C1 [Oldenlandia corymbosa var. corymbosa]|uniref:OLC1v1007179C1 n=1 Tax=Oldenlandia corymbosa var. corymbosa TaxID=529605 RepID=A0AAV1DIQ4_OLDCO|nr:OLC1v1007179C1 [Oldenlandia corymbosa var. corymbosa]